jgi:hypothetical protein
MEKAILRTLAYADIFDYPLTEEEIWRWMIGEQATSNRQKEIEKRLKENSYLLSHISYRQGFYSLKGRENIVALRKKRERFSASKLKLAEKVAGILRLIPWVKMVGVTGALAMKNSDKEDDIDLLIITSKNRLWLTRGLVVSFLRLTGLYRRPGKIKNKICPNMLLDENHLAIPKKERDLFSAHEVCQLRPIFVRENTYSRFLQENSWAKKFLPNALDLKILKGKTSKNNKLITNYQLPITWLEAFARKLQLSYMQSRRTNEVVEPGRIRFHPEDAREWVLKEYKERLNNLGIRQKNSKITR